jgi:chromosome segregation protein
MGEQSMKSIRSKSLCDLIYKGGGDLTNSSTQMSRASVSIELDNSGINKKQSTENEGEGSAISKYLTYDEIILSREVFVDGASIYKVNGGEVRLKDVQSLLAFAGIGASAHTIISQGEADKILVASKKDRKEMIEDSLGLKIHHIRLKDSERKLKKVEENIRVADLLRREMVPELNHLKIQMEKISKIEIEREKLLNAYLSYFAYENNCINNLKIELNKNTDQDVDILILENKNKINNLKLEIEKTKQENTKSQESISLEKLEIKNEINAEREKLLTFEKELSVLNYEKRKLLESLQNEVREIVIDKTIFINFKNSIQEKILENNFDLEYIKSYILETLNNYLSESINKDILNNKINLELENIKLKEGGILDNINNIKNIILNKENKLDNLQSTALFSDLGDIYSCAYKLEKEIDILEKNKIDIVYKKQESESREKSFVFDLEEATKFVGHKVLSYKNINILDLENQKYDHQNSARSIERLKIRIEELGILDPTTVKNSFEEMNGRNIHLEKEIDDLNKTKISLDQLVLDLENNIKKDFEKGLEKINFAFNNFFNEVFPGGRASVFVEKVLSEEGDEEGSNNVVDGVDIKINLPSKKVNDINMLSGGERTLASIALLFAMTSILPPPFMVLDETDAALDEMNAKKYGKMLGRLSQKSRLLVITHNRETMNECDVLYGVTMGAEGFSRMLSIKFD